MLYPYSWGNEQIIRTLVEMIIDIEEKNVINDNRRGLYLKNRGQ